MEGGAGIEPTSEDSESSALTIMLTAQTGARCLGSNGRPPEYKTGALPTAPTVRKTPPRLTKASCIFTTAHRTAPPLELTGVTGGTRILYGLVHNQAPRPLRLPSHSENANNAFNSIRFSRVGLATDSGWHHVTVMGEATPCPSTNVSPPP